MLCVPRTRLQSNSALSIFGLTSNAGKDWCPTFPGLHIFYASKRQCSPALSLIVEALKYRYQRGSLARDDAHR